MIGKLPVLARNYLAGVWGQRPQERREAEDRCRRAGAGGEASPLIKLHITFPCGGFILLFFVSLFISCKSAPDFPDPVLGESGFIPLEPGALVYVFADVGGARPILDLVPIAGMNEKQSKEMLDRTRSVAAALYPGESGRRFQLTAWGTYPGFRADMAFGTNRDWKKRRSAGGLPYWHSARDRLSVALNAKQAFVSAAVDDAPLEPFSAPPGIEAPEGFGEFRRGAIISCWLENPGSAMNRAFAAMEIPLQLPAERIFVSVFQTAGQADSGGGAGEAAERRYEALLRIQLPGASQARGMVTLFTLARAFLPGFTPAEGALSEGGPAALAAFLFANPPVQDGKNLTIKTAVLSERDIALLFNLFSVYFA